MLATGVPQGSGGSPRCLCSVHSWRTSSTSSTSSYVCLDAFHSCISNQPSLTQPEPLIQWPPGNFQVCSQQNSLSGCHQSCSQACSSPEQFSCDDGTIAYHIDRLQTSGFSFVPFLHCISQDLAIKTPDCISETSLEFIRTTSVHLPSISWMGKSLPAELWDSYKASTLVCLP